MPATNELLAEESVPVGPPSSAVEGDTLEELLKRNNRPFPISDVLAWADQLLEALGNHHKSSPSVVHQNLRPENIVLSPDGSVKLRGSGQNVTRSIGDANLRYCPLEQIWGGLDAASQKVITNSYDERSERILKSPLDARSDLYSLAATLYYALTATPPVDALERSIEMLDGNSDPLRDLAELNANVPADVSQVVLKALEVKRENRFDSAAIMRQVLRSAAAKLKGRDDLEIEIDTKGADVTRAAEAAKAEARRAEEHRREAEELDRKRREIEEQKRLEAERKASGERRRQEESAAAAHVSAKTDAVAGDPIELDISVMPNVEAHISAPPTDSGKVGQSNARPTPRAENTTSTTLKVEEEPEFKYQEHAGGSSMFSVPVIAGAAAAVLLLVVGIYFVAFSGSSAPPAAKAEMKPEPVQSQPSPEQIAPATNPDPNVIAAEAAPQAVEQNAASPAKTETPKAIVKPTPAKEAKPAKEPAKEKKPVTADDLINDAN